MENATKALIIVANLMLAVIIMSVIVYFFQNMRILPEEQEREKVAEQIAKFNEEYLVFDKKLMYGVDVISALNKADSNNEKYIQGKFLSGGAGGEEFIIDIVVTLKRPLEESVEVKYLADNNSREQSYATNQGLGRLTFNDIKSTYKNFILPSDLYREKVFNNNIKNSSGNTYTNIGDIPLVTQTFKTAIADGSKKTYRLLDIEENTYDVDEKYKKSDISDSTVLKQLISMSDAIIQTVKNTDSDVTKKHMATNCDMPNVSTEGWSSFTWKTALYDLKTRKFKCAEIDDSGNEIGPGIHYNLKTGVIQKIEFVEI